MARCTMPNESAPVYLAMSHNMRVIRTMYRLLSAANTMSIVLSGKPAKIARHVTRKAVIRKVARVTRKGR